MDALLTNINDGFKSNGTDDSTTSEFILLIQKLRQITNEEVNEVIKRFGTKSADEEEIAKKRRWKVYSIIIAWLQLINKSISQSINQSVSYKDMELYTMLIPSVQSYSSEQTSEPWMKLGWSINQSRNIFFIFRYVVKFSSFQWFFLFAGDITVMDKQFVINLQRNSRGCSCCG